jgi:hypothetical protein
VAAAGPKGHPGLILAENMVSAGAMALLDPADWQKLLLDFSRLFLLDVDLSRMKKVFSSNSLIAAALGLFVVSSPAQYSMPPGSPQEVEATYNTAIENRTAAIVTLLKLTDPEKSARVHDVIIAQYRTLKARDEAIDSLLKLQGKEINYSNRAHLLVSESKPLHDQFLARLAADLTPEQVEIVKDKMTYNKVQVTYDAYCSIIPGLTDADKAEVLTVLKQAREEAMDGGNAGEKSAIFQKYKDQINDYLNAHGHDVAKAYKDWEAKQQVANKPADAAPPKTNEPAK